MVDTGRARPSCAPRALGPRSEADAAAERRAIDRSNSLSGRIDAAMSSTVDCWVKTAVDTDDKFKKLNVRRSTPQNGRAGSGLSDYNQWSYEGRAAARVRDRDARPPSSSVDRRVELAFSRPRQDLAHAFFGGRGRPSDASVRPASASAVSTCESASGLRRGR